MGEVLSVEDGRVVLIHYVLKNDEGTVLDRSTTEPLAYLHGYGNIVPGLEAALLGKKPGDAIHVDVAPADGYGERDADAYQSVHRSEFPQGMDLSVGMPLRAQTSDGRAVMLWISKMEGAQVTVTPNHPLAGATLHFDVQIVSIREPSDEEREHGHVHGAGGHHH